MELTKDELRQVLLELKAEADPPLHIEFEEARSGKIGGFILWKKFEGMTQRDRQNMIWDHLEKALPDEKRQRIITILTLTPAEADFAA